MLEYQQLNHYSKCQSSMFLCVAILCLFRFNCLFLSEHNTHLTLTDNNHLVSVKKTSWFGLKYLFFFVARIIDRDVPTSGEVVPTKTRKMSLSP